MASEYNLITIPLKTPIHHDLRYGFKYKVECGDKFGEDDSIDTLYMKDGGYGSDSIFRRSLCGDIYDNTIFRTKCRYKPVLFGLFERQKSINDIIEEFLIAVNSNFYECESIKGSMIMMLTINNIYPIHKDYYGVPLPYEFKYSQKIRVERHRYANKIEIQSKSNPEKYYSLSNDITEPDHFDIVHLIKLNKEVSM